jgi:hypothetical protein
MENGQKRRTKQFGNTGRYQVKIPPTNLQYSSIYKTIYQLSEFKEQVFPTAQITVDQYRLVLLFKKKN